MSPTKLEICYGDVLIVIIRTNVGGASNDPPRAPGPVGETRRRTYPESYHPVFFHLIDVAVVARRIWEEVLRPPVKVSFSTTLGLSVEDCGPWVAFLVGARHREGVAGLRAAGQREGPRSAPVQGGL